MKTKAGGSAQDRRRARRAVGRALVAASTEAATIEDDFAERFAALAADLAATHSLTTEESIDRLHLQFGHRMPLGEEETEPLSETVAEEGAVCTCGHPGGMHSALDDDENMGACSADDCSCDGFTAAKSSSASSERLALAAMTEALQHGSACSCGHSFTEHASADGECMHSDGRGTCSCDGFSERQSSESAQQAQELALADRIERAAEVLADGNADAVPVMRMRLTNVVLADAVLPAELTPGERIPAPNPSPAAPEPMPTSASAKDGVPWTATLCPEAVVTDDGRCFAPGSMDWRELPLSLMAMIETQEGHDGAQLSGRIDQIWRDGMDIKASGVFDPGDYGSEIARLVAEKFLTGISVDIAVHEFEVGPRSQWFDADGNWAPQEAAADERSLVEVLFDDAPGEAPIFVVTSGTIGAATVCPFQAFREATIEVAKSLVSAGSPAVWTVTTATLTLAEEQDAPEAITAAAAGLVPLKPPAEWFADPRLEAPTALQITDDGQIFGHAALWDTCHIGIPGVCTTPPSSETNYAYFLLKEVECDDGARIRCGTVTLEAPHADRRLGRADATAHYDHTGTAAADVNVGEDEHGIWVAGALRPDVDEEQVRDLLGATLSGDWRNVSGNLELVALLAVNVPGFPVPRTRALVASANDGGNEVLTLTAAGVNLEPLIPAEHRARYQQLRLRAEAPALAALAKRART